MLEQRSSLCLFRCNLDTKFMFCRRHMNKYKHLKWIHNNLLLLVLLEAIFLLTFLFSIGRCSTWQCGSVNQERSNRLCPQMPDDKVRWAGRWLLHAPCHVDWAVRGKTGALNVPQLFIFFISFSFIHSFCVWPFFWTCSLICFLARALFQFSANGEKRAEKMPDIA